MSENNTPVPSLNEPSFTDLLFDNGSFSAQVGGELRPLDERYTPHAERLLALCMAHPNDNDEGFKIAYDGMSFRCTELENISSDSCFVLRKPADTGHTWCVLRLLSLMRDQILFGGERDSNDQEENVKRGGMVVVFGETNSCKSPIINALIYQIAELESWLIMSFAEPSEVLFTKTYGTGAKGFQETIHWKSFQMDSRLPFAPVRESLKWERYATSKPLHKLFEQNFCCCLHQTLAVRPGVSNRLLDYTFLSKTRTVSNLLKDANFKGLEQEIQTQTLQAKKGG
jgi:hypothetical protein